MDTDTRRYIQNVERRIRTNSQTWKQPKCPSRTDWTNSSMFIGEYYTPMKISGFHLLTATGINLIKSHPTKWQSHIQRTAYCRVPLHVSRHFCNITTLQETLNFFLIWSPTKWNATDACGQCLRTIYNRALYIRWLSIMLIRFFLNTGLRIISELEIKLKNLKHI